MKVLEQYDSYNLTQIRFIMIIYPFRKRFTYMPIYVYQWSLTLRHIYAKFISIIMKQNIHHHKRGGLAHLALDIGFVILV